MSFGERINLKNMSKINKKLYKDIYKALRKNGYSDKEAASWILRSMKLAKDRQDFKELLREAEKEREIR